MLLSYNSREWVVLNTTFLSQVSVCSTPTTKCQIRPSFIAIPLTLIVFNTRVRRMLRYELRFSNILVAPQVALNARCHRAVHEWQVYEQRAIIEWTAWRPRVVASRSRRLCQATQVKLILTARGGDGKDDGGGDGKVPGAFNELSP